MKNKFNPKSLGLFLMCLFALITFIADMIYFQSGLSGSIAFLPFMFRINRDSGAGGAGGSAEKEEAIKQVKTIATDTAERVFAEKAKDILDSGFKSDATKKLMKEMTDQALKELDLSGIEITEADGKKTAIKTIFKELQDQHDKMEVRVKSILDGTAGQNALKSFGDQVQAGLDNVKDELKNIQGNQSHKGLNFNVKAAGTMTIAGNYSGGVVGLSAWDNEFARIQRRQPFMRELVRVVTTDNLYIAWAEQANPDGAVDTVAEAAAKPQIDFDIVERSAKVEKIAGYIKASKEALADIKFLRGEIDTELRELINIKLDEQILNGNGTTPNLKGVLQYAPTFAAGAAFANLVPGANKYDVIVAAIAQIAAANFNADTVVINPADYFSMMLLKNSENTYNRPIFIDDSGMRIAGLRVVWNNGMTVGTFLVGDFKRDTLAMREEVNIQVGYVNDDFTKNLVTILAEVRAVNYVKTNYVNAFVKGSFATAITAIDLPAA